MHPAVKYLSRMFKKEHPKRDFICLYLRDDETYLFQYLDEKCVPFMYPVELLGMVEEDIVTIQKVLADVFNTPSLKVRISYEVQTLEPVLPENYYLSIVDLPAEALDDLFLDKNTPTMKVRLSSILLKRDSNIFFDLLCRELNLT